MKLSDLPSGTFPIAFASGAGGGYIRQVPTASQIGITNGAASLTDGFPPLTFLPVGSGGVPPFGQDFNGILNQITQWTRWQNAGGLPTYSSAFSTAIGGYPKGSVLSSSVTAGLVWLNTADDNTTNPDSAGAGWILVGTSTGIITNQYTYANAAGSVNAITATFSPFPSVLSAGIGITLLFTTANTGAATLSVNGSATAPIVNQFGAALTGGELIGPVRLTYDGTQWWASIVAAGLTANRTYYVNAGTGSDSNNGLTTGTAFATIQKAINVASLINLNGFNITINVADGTYAGIISKPLTGSGQITINGNTTTPANVQVNGTSGNNGIFILNPGYVLQGLSPLGNGSGVHNISVGSTSCSVGTMYHRAPPSNAAQIFSGQGGAISLTGNHNVAGGGFAHLFASSGGSIQNSLSSPPAMTFSATSNFTTGLVVATTNASISALYSSFTTPGNAPGVKFAVSSNATINSVGNGINYYPGATAGTTATGGQYI